MPKRDPWHGQCHSRRSASKATTQRRWVQIGESAWTVPSSAAVGGGLLAVDVDDRALAGLEVVERSGEAHADAIDDEAQRRQRELQAGARDAG